MNWQPIADARKDGTRYLLCQVGGRTKPRYPIVIGAWNEKFRTWQSVPGAWTVTPTHFAPMPTLPEPR